MGPFSAKVSNHALGHAHTLGGQRWGPADGLPSLCVGDDVGLKQAPDGELWMKAQDHIARFDGSTWLRLLSEQAISDWDIAPDGSVWLQADDDLYVITPEAVASNE